MGDIVTKYVIPGLEVAGGAVSEVVAPGNPAGLGLMANGTGQLAGGAAGGKQGQDLGGMVGSLVGGGFGGLGGGLSPDQAGGLSDLNALQASLSGGQAPDLSAVIGAGTQAGSSSGSGGDFLKNISQLLTTGGDLSSAIMPTAKRQPGQAPAPVNARGKSGQGITAPSLIQDQNFKPQSMVSAAKALSSGMSPQLLALLQKLSNASANG